MSGATQVIAASLLDTWTAHDWSNAVPLHSLPDLTEIHVRTRNSIYEILVIDHQSGEILIRGGRFFADRTAAYLAGSSLRGSFIKSGVIHVGMNLEVLAGRETIVTSRVQSVVVIPPSE